MGFFSQYKALLYKNWILWKRKKFGSLCEVLFPIGLIILIGLLRIDNPATDKSAKTFDDQLQNSFLVSPSTSDYIANNIPAYKMPFSSCYTGGYPPSTILGYSIISDDPSLTDYLETKISELSNGLMPSSFNQVFSTVSQFEDYVRGSSYEDNRKLCFGVYFKKNSELSYRTEYRYNTTQNLPGDKRLGDKVDVFWLNTHTNYDDLIVSPSPFGTQFYESGFLTLTNLVDNYLLKKFLNDDNAEIKAIISPQRFDDYISDDFLISIGSILPFFIIISYLIPVSRLLSSIVHEKETKTKELMMMMGLRNQAYWFSWITFYFVIYTIISIILTILCAVMGVYKYSNNGLIFIFFWLFGMSCIAFSVFISMFFSKSRSAVLLGVPVFIGSYFISFAVADPAISMNKKASASLLPPIAFTLASTWITDMEIGQAGVQNDNTNFESHNYTFAVYIGMLIVDIFYMSILAVYLESVWPTEWGVQRPWYFLFTKKFWCPTKVHSNDMLLEETVEWGDAVEKVDAGLEAQKTSKKAMLVRGLTKHFNNKVAVEELNLDIYEGQIFALLGHNGAGKTTTMSMLSGLIPPTSGDMTVNNLFVSKDLSKIRENLGFCPQHNVLFPDLTPVEHMYLFCKFKGINDSKQIDEMIKQKLIELEMRPQADQLVKNLSGGQKRKLSLAIALIGNSPIVMLDEPTSGMDLTARRHMWDMLKSNKNGRIIILTTHYMEEADVLADRIAIMSSGKLRCCGSSMFLKSRYGVGYYLTLVRNQESINNTKNLENFVSQNIKDSKLMSDYHGEITFQLPQSSAGQFVNFFENLDKNLENFGLLSYSISATTLEEVFLRVARGDDEQLKKHIDKEADESSPLLHDPFILERDRVQGSVFGSHFLALLRKRAISSKRDYKSLLYEIFIPILLIIFGITLMMIPPYLSNFSARELSLSLYKEPQRIYYGGADGSSYLSKIPNINIINSKLSTPRAFSDYFFTKGLHEDLITSYYFHSLDSSKHTYNFTAFYNPKAYQSPVVTYITMSEAIIKSSFPSFSSLTFNHPLPITKEMDKDEDNGDGFTGSLIFALGFSFIPTGIVMLIAKEREFNVKHQHMISGVSLLAYWLSNFFWDCIKHILPAVVSSLIILAFQIHIYTDDSDDFGAILVLIILTGIAQAPFSYMFSFFFKSHSTAQIVMLILSFVTGSALPSGVFAMYIFESSRDAGKVISWILRIFPNFCFGWGVLNIGSKDAFKYYLKQPSAYNAFSIDSAGGCILLLGIHIVFYFLMVLLLELLETNPKIAQCIQGKKLIHPEVFDHDADVVNEAAIAESTNPDDVKVNAKKLAKSFKINGILFTAVNELSFNVQNEECFALLGINGAGKTTTFKMLTGEIPSDSGLAFVGGKNVSTELSAARNLIGYCPQFDALTENLTAREHLTLYASIKGIPKDQIATQVNFMLKHMDLTQYADILAGTYSGGNKRKLSVAMALIGNPSVVFLDEPSAGMDPEARKKMWKILGSLKKKKSAVILTTHSMEEAEALCDRMTIMVRGRLKCIGTPTWIKNKFGDGYELEIKIEIPTQQEINNFSVRVTQATGTSGLIDFKNIDKCLEALQSSYLKGFIAPIGPGASIYNSIVSDGGATIEALASWCLIENLGFYIKSWLETEFTFVEVIEHYNLMSKFKLKKENVKSIGYLFSVIEEKRHEMKISDYTICMTSLEQIFNRFAKMAEQEDLDRLRKSS